jgi:hypothetical protein
MNTRKEKEINLVHREGGRRRRSHRKRKVTVPKN